MKHGDKKDKFYNKGRKNDCGKPQFCMLPWDVLQHVAWVMEFGAMKYKRDNWKKVKGGRERYLNAAFRHMAALAKGERQDYETNLPHEAHAICSLLFSLWHRIEHQTVKELNQK